MRKKLTGRQNTSSSVDLLFLMEDIWMPCDAWRKATDGKQTHGQYLAWSVSACQLGLEEYLKRVGDEGQGQVGLI